MILKNFQRIVYYIWSLGATLSYSYHSVPFRNIIHHFKSWCLTSCHAHSSKFTILEPSTDDLIGDILNKSWTLLLWLGSQIQWAVPSNLILMPTLVSSNARRDANSMTFSMFLKYVQEYVWKIRKSIAKRWKIYPVSLLFHRSFLTPKRSGSRPIFKSDVYSDCIAIDKEAMHLHAKQCAVLQCSSQSTD